MLVCVLGGDVSSAVTVHNNVPNILIVVVLKNIHLTPYLPLFYTLRFSFWSSSTVFIRKMTSGYQPFLVRIIKKTIL